MKIAITADIHLTNKKKHPERWKTFENILSDITKKNIYKIIICGDLFNDDYHNYSEFDKLTAEYKNIDFIIIPGNHDPNISENAITGSNVTIYTEPEIISFDDSKIPFLFLPYKGKINMGEQLVSYKNELKPNKWVLISHGDWADSIQTPNPIEPGIYMPLSRKDISEHKPVLTVLGHIHKPIDNEDFNVHYVGSPCGLDITETGRRRYLILDTETFEIEKVEVNSHVIYFDETVVVYPMENEKEYWKSEIKKIKDKWNLTSDEKAKAIIRIRVKGYSSDKRELKRYFDSEFEDYPFWNNEEVNVSEVSDSDNYELLKISEKVLKRINELELVEKEEEPTRKDILYKAIERIYSIK